MSALHIAPEPSDSPAELRAEIYDVSPAVATRWLHRNVRNRRLNPPVVAAYARDMAAGRWDYTGEAIKFDSNGALADGQHRLHAIVKSGATVQMLIVRGVQPEAQDKMDSGRKRSASDALLMAGKKNVSILESAARFALLEPGAGFAATPLYKPTNAEVHDFVDNLGETLETAAEIARHYGGQNGFDAPLSVLCVAWMRLSNIDQDACTEFFSSIAEARTNGAGDPRLALMRRLGSIRSDKQRPAQSVYLSLIFRAWNLWRTSKTARSLPTHIGNDIVKIPEPR